MGILSYIKPSRDGKDGKSNSADGKNASHEPKPGPMAPAGDGAALVPRPQSLYPTTPTGSGSRPVSFNDEKALYSDTKNELMVSWLYQQQMERLWTDGTNDEGVMLKKARNAYTSCPETLREQPDGFFKAVETLNVRVAITVNTRVMALLSRTDKPYVPLKNGLRLQVLPTISSLPRCQKHQFAAIIQDRGIMVVWDDEPKDVLDRAQNFEKELMEVVWEHDNAEETDEKKILDGVADSESPFDDDCVERGAVEKPRQIYLLMPFLSAITLCLTVLALGAGYRLIAIETYVDNNFVRLAFVAALPAQVWLGLFFFQALVGNIAQIVGTVGQMKENTKYYSGKPPKPLRRDAGPLPHLTIQMPVYKEGLQGVIAPTVFSVKAAMSTYEMQGGTANIFVNDDGMQVISEDDARARQDFYDEHNIGWTARPAHNPKPKNGEEPFMRRGKFKKASNMNYGMWVSTRIEEKLESLHRPDTWTQEDEAAAYRDALAEVVEKDEGRTWADGNIRMGDYLLLIDSDTRMPKDCFLDCVSEMEQSPQVAILQYSSGVMNVTDSFFERGITFFTNLVYTQICYAIATGDVAPFVGHNAVLRWSAVQAVSFECEDDKREKWWSERTVSEDFDMSLRLQTEGFIVRLAAYTGEGFQEGVSLTVYDELARWEKYAYGCSELIFNPLKDWLRKGPFTGLFVRFMSSSMPFPSKCTIMAYIGTYYALGSAWLLTLANYFLTGWYNGHLDHYYLDSFKVYFSIILCFSGLGNISLAVLRYRHGERTLWSSLVENFTWIPLLSIFLGGISLHVSQAILSHMFSVDMSWGSTNKEAEETTFFKEVPKILKKFKVTFIACIFCIAMIVVMAKFAPPLWRIDLFISIWPLGSIVFGHFLLPIALNPGLMKFTW